MNHDNRNNSAANSLANSCDQLVQDEKTFIPIRYIIIILSFFACFIMFVLRLNLSVAIVSMVNHTALHHANQLLNSSIVIDEGSCSGEGPNATEELEIAYRGELIWSESVQGLVLGSYFYGYTLTQIVGGRLAERWGGKWPTLIAVLVQIICSLLTPISTFHVIIVCVCRFVMGLFTGFIFPSMFTLYSSWIPKNERASALGITVTGCNVGSVVAMLLTAWLCEFSLGDGPGWPLAFYVPGLFALIWVILWICIVTNTPSENRLISKSELKLIKNGVDVIPKKVENIPWKSVFLSIRVWALILTKCLCFFGYNVIASKLPSYLESVLKMDMTKNGLVNAMVYVTMAITSPIGGPLSDYVRRKEIISVTAIRKIFQSIAFIGPTVALVLIPMAGCNIMLVVILLILSMSTTGFETGGATPIVSEMAPAISGTVFGVTNTFSCTIGFIAPLLSGMILGDNPTSRTSWNIIFYLSAGLSALGIIVFDLFASAEVQPWGIGEVKSGNKKTVNLKEEQKEKSPSFNGIIIIPAKEVN